MEVNDEAESLADTLVSDVNTTVFPAHDRTVPSIGKVQFIDALAGHDDEEDEGSEIEDAEMVELSSSSDSEGTGSEDDGMHLYLSKPVKAVRQSMKTQSMKAGSTNSRANHELNVEDEYDPLTCRKSPIQKLQDIANGYIFLAFKVSGVVHHSDGADAPITIPSKTTLDKLRIAVAEKLGRFPGLVMLQYRLSSDNAKVGVISIQSNEELQIFKNRMRKLIVPPHLANGKASTQTLKAVLVYFEDASSEIKDTPTSSGGSKKVFILCYTASILSSLLFL
jgi:hypothetical protein